MEEEQIFSDIVKLCIEIEENASEIYKKFSEESKEKDLKEFWLEMYKRGILHIDYYKKLLKFTDQSVFFQLFSNINVIREELRNYKKEIEEIIKSDTSKHNHFTTAYQVEYYLLHPVFETIYTFARTLFPEITEKDSYYTQLNKLQQRAMNLHKQNMELSLIGRCLNDIIKKNRELTYQNFFDQSSGVLNIRGFFHNIRPLSYLAVRKKFNVGILIFDIDQFKKTFKEFPPLEREKIIKLIADQIKTHIRRSDLIGRYGDDKLILYLSDIKKDYIEAFAKKIKKNIESKKYLNIKITVSIGGVQAYITENPMKKIDYLFRSAEEALFLAKSSEDNKIIISKIIKT